MGFLNVKRFLEAPLKFSDQSESRVRSRSVPISQTLSQPFGESYLFVMEFHISGVSGLELYRLQDDFFFWNHDEEAKVDVAWRAMNQYVNLIGLKKMHQFASFHACKTSSASL
jgi:hypothetical protein